MITRSTKNWVDPFSSSLYDALRCKKWEKAKLLIEKGEGIQYINVFHNRRRYTMLHVAVLKQAPNEILTSLVNVIPVQTEAYDRTTPLDVAFNCRDGRCFARLIGLGAHFPIYDFIEKYVQYWPELICCYEDAFTQDLNECLDLVNFSFGNQVGVSNWTKIVSKALLSFGANPFARNIIEELTENEDELSFGGYLAGTQLMIVLVSASKIPRISSRCPTIRNVPKELWMMVQTCLYHNLK